MYICDAVTVKGLQRRHFSSSYHVPGYGDKILTDNFLHSQGGFECTSTMFVGYYCRVMRHSFRVIISFIISKQAKSGVTLSILYQT